MALFEDVVDDIEVSLGGNLVSVELEETDYKVAMRRAISKYKQYGANNYQHVYMRVPVKAGTKTIDIPSDVSTIIKIIRPSMGINMSSEDLFVQKQIDEMFSIKSFSTGCGFNFLQYEMMQGRQENFQRYSGQDVDFSHNKFNNSLTVFNVPKKDEIWFVECYLDLTEEQYLDVHWVVEYMRAECMEILGRAYGKFSGGVAGPNGDVQLDGRSMIQEAQEIKRELKEDAENNMSGGVDYYGIYIA